MKGIATRTVILVAAIILVFGALAVAWMSGFLPIGKEFAKVTCWREMGVACRRHSEGRIDVADIESVWEECMEYFPHDSYVDFCEEEAQVTLPLP
jgi:hypothetical protein